MSVARATTPTIALDFTDRNLDLTEASNVYVTLAQMPRKLTKTGADLEISAKRIEVYLTQEETLKFFEGEVRIQANWTYSGGRRGASKVRIINLSEQLLPEVLA